jgi:mediator of RNA polymerase II transcription subunit 5
MLLVATFVASFLQAARSPELHNAATLDILCRIALEAHYSSGMPPIGSVVSYSESPIVVLGTIQDALALLRTAYSIHPSYSRQLISSASELVILLSSCVTDMSQISTAQAMVHFADTNDMLQTLRLSPDVRQVLETFVMSLSLIIGDDAKAAREAQMMQSLQLVLGKNDLLGPSSDADTVTCGLLLHHLVSTFDMCFGVDDKLFCSSSAERVLSVLEVDRKQWLVS